MKSVKKYVIMNEYRNRWTEEGGGLFQHVLVSAKGWVILMGYANRAAAYREEPAVRQETEEFQLVLANPERYEDAGGIARHFDARHPVVLNLEGVTKDAALRLVDFLGGVAYAKGGELVRIAKNAFLLVPNTATVESTVLDEWDEIGKY